MRKIRLQLICNLTSTLHTIAFEVDVLNLALKKEVDFFRCRASGWLWIQFSTVLCTPLSPEVNEILNTFLIDRRLDSDEEISRLCRWCFRTFHRNVFQQFEYFLAYLLVAYRHAFCDLQELIMHPIAQNNSSKLNSSLHSSKPSSFTIFGKRKWSLSQLLQII